MTTTVVYESCLGGYHLPSPTGAVADIFDAFAKPEL